MEIKGKVIKSLGVQNGTSKAGKSWSKATVIIETEDQYPKKVALDNMKEADKFGSLPVGSTGVFHIEIDSREFNGRWYTSVNCWKWNLEQTTQPQQSNPAQEGWQSAYPTAQPAPVQTEIPAEGDDLPF